MLNEVIVTVMIISCKLPDIQERFAGQLPVSKRSTVLDTSMQLIIMLCLTSWDYKT